MSGDPTRRVGACHGLVRFGLAGLGSTAGGRRSKGRGEPRPTGGAARGPLSLWSPIRPVLQAEARGRQAPWLTRGRVRQLLTSTCLRGRGCIGGAVGRGAGRRTGKGSKRPHPPTP